MFQKMLLKNVAGSLPLCSVNDYQTDVIIKCSGGKISVHKLIIAAQSEFLKSILLDENTDVIILPDVSISTCAEFIDVIYGAEMQEPAQTNVMMMSDIFKCDNTPIIKLVTENTLNVPIFDSTQQHWSNQDFADGGEELSLQEVEEVVLNVVTDASLLNTGEHSGSCLLVCENCGFKCKRKEGLTKHKRAKHGTAKLLNIGSTVCVTCNKVLPKKEILKHIQSCGADVPSIQEAKPKLSCDICSKEFKFTSKLLRHRSSAHNTGASFSCNKCHFKTKSEEALKRHFRRHNTVIYCENCDYCTDSVFNLKRHSKQHEKPIQCEICNKPVASKEALKKHMSLKH